MKKKIINKKETNNKLLEPNILISPFCEMCGKREQENSHEVGVDKKDAEKRKIHLENLDKKELKIYKKLEKEARKKNPEDPRIDICTLCHAKVHNIEPKRSELKDNVVRLNRNQKARIVIDNQIRGFGRIEMKVPSYYLKIKDILVEEEKKLVKEITYLLEGNGDHIIFAKTQKKHVSSQISKKKGDHERVAKTQTKNVSFPIYSWLKKQKGIGPINSAYLIAYINFEKTPSIPALWCYCGQTPDSKKKKGQKMKGNPVLKQRCHLIAESFIKSKSPYKKIYDKEKKKRLKLMEKDQSHNAKTQNIVVAPSNNNLGLKKKDQSLHAKTLGIDVLSSIPKSRMHCHNRAMLKMVKSFLKDLWLEWNNIHKKETS